MQQEMQLKLSYNPTETQLQGIVVSKKSANHTSEKNAVKHQKPAAC